MISAFFVLCGGIVAMVLIAIALVYTYAMDKLSYKGERSITVAMFILVILCCVLNMLLVYLVYQG